jgi:hypothetical protein
MSEELNQSSNEPARERAEEAAPASEGRELPEVTGREQAEAGPAASEPQEGSEAIVPAQEGQGQPTSEVYIQPEEIAPAGQLQYPPPPESYAQVGQPPRIQNPYAAPQEPPRIQNPYAAPATGYGAPGSAPPVYGYGYEPIPQAQPLPLGQAIRELPAQYRKILFKPGPRSFAEEQGKAEWGIIWIQILFLMVFEAILALPVGLVDIPVLNSSLSAAGAAPISSSTFLTVATIAVVVFAPIAFFALVGIQYLLGRAFQGRGQFKQQAYNQLLFQVPTIFITSLLYLIMTPFLGGMASMLAVTPGSTTIPSVNPLGLVVILVVGLLAWAISIYGIVLNIFSIMAAHRISGGRATGVVLIPYAVLLVLYFGCVCASTLVTLSSIHS